MLTSFLTLSLYYYVLDPKADIPNFIPHVLSDCSPAQPFGFLSISWSRNPFAAPFLPVDSIYAQRLPPSRCFNFPSCHLRVDRHYAPSWAS
jgi:hypothetical protein